MNTREKDQFLAHWMLARRRGVLAYVLGTALSWGTVAAVFARFFNTLFTRGLTRASLAEAFLSASFLDFWGKFLLGGLVFALILWFYYRRLYRRLRHSGEMKNVKE